MDTEHGCLEAKGISPKGDRVEVYVDTNDGKIVRIKD
jgi:Tfp pilus assembly protein PilP